jgi:diguanylate cyclase (GGDEF)-like protein
MNNYDAQAARRRQLAVSTYVGAIATVAIVMLFALLRAEHQLLPASNRIPIALFAILLFLGETQPRLWMRFGDEGEVTPGWAFAYAILLLGSPFAAVATMIVANLFVDIRTARGPLKIVFNVSQVTVALCAAGFVLHLFGVRNGITGLDQLPPGLGLAVTAGGLTIFVVNTCLTAAVLCIHLGISPAQLAQASFVLTMGVDGALLAMAPVFVIAVQFSLLMLPLLVITSFLVFHSARTAMKREHEANHDPLTLLLNRRAFDDRLASALDTIGTEHEILVLLMDLDRFKDVNDRLGHQTGDRLLRSFGERLERSLPAAASASRLGGDEFAAIIPLRGSVDEARRIVARLHVVLSEAHDLAGFPLSSAVSIGAAIAPLNGKSAISVVAAADLAMYRAKQFGTGVEFADQNDDNHEVGRVGLLTDLQAAIGTSQIVAHYQPLVRLSDGRIDSVEALIRWEHPRFGSIAPNDFITMAEQTDLIGPLTETMLRSSMREMMTFGEAMPRLSVNIAARSLQDRRFAADVIALVDELGFPPDRLELEVTERDIVTNSERSVLALARLRGHGIRIAIDDFGTGYSSFLTLRDLSADRLKIDQQFTANIIDSDADRLIVAKVIEIAHALRLDVVAEGVESDAVWGRLTELGCDLAQGYAIARPMSLAALRQWIDSRRGDGRGERERTVHVLPAEPRRPMMFVGTLDPVAGPIRQPQHELMLP